AGSISMKFPKAARATPPPGSPRKPRRFRPQSSQNRCWWRSTSAATISTARPLPGISAAGGMSRSPTLFSRSAARTDFRPICGAKPDSGWRSAPRPGRIKWSASCFWNRFIGPRPFWPVIPITAHKPRQRRPLKGHRTGSMQPRRNIQSYPDTARRGRLDSVRIPLSIALLSAGFAGMSLLPASAQVAGAAAQTTAASPDAIKQREQELEATRAQQKSAADAQTKLQAEIAAIGQDRSKLNQQLIDIAAQVRGVETRIGDAEARLRPLDSRE